MSPEAIKKKKDLAMCCPSCNSFNIIHDFTHAESYCGNCGLVCISNNSVRRYSIIKFKPKPKSDEQKIIHIIDVLINSLNIKKFY